MWSSISSAVTNISIHILRIVLHPWFFRPESLEPGGWFILRICCCLSEVIQVLSILSIIFYAGVHQEVLKLWALLLVYGMMVMENVAHLGHCQFIRLPCMWLEWEFCPFFCQDKLFRSWHSWTVGLNWHEKYWLHSIDDYHASLLYLHGMWWSYGLAWQEV